MNPSKKTAIKVEVILDKYKTLAMSSKLLWEIYAECKAKDCLHLFGYVIKIKKGRLL